jgi:tRNA-dihydrouridine synthase C
MEGVLDWTLRELLSSIGGVDRMVTEFVRVTDLLLPEHVFYRYCPELKQGGCTAAGTPVFIQLLGGQPAPLAENAARAVALGAPGIDLNFGCPAKTVNRHDGGATLLKEPSRLFNILTAVRAAVPQVPVTAKVRLGFDHKDFHREIAQAVEEAGAEYIVVHARTKTEMYTPPAHWEYIQSMREGRSLKFLANGEIWSVADYWACVAKSGVHDVALGRGLVRTPTLALQIRASVAARKTGTEPLPIAFDRLRFLKTFFDHTLQFRGGQYTVARMKQMLRYWRDGDSQSRLWFVAM